MMKSKNGKIQLLRKRGEEYLLFKQEKAEKFINEIEKDFPDIRKMH